MTTLSESFNKADAGTLGPDLSWTELLGNLNVVSNAAQAQSISSASTDFARADSDLATTDHYAEVQVTALTPTNTTGDVAGPTCRKDSSATITTYWARLSRKTPSTDQIQLFKVVAGTATQLGSSVAVTVSLPNTIRVQAVGTTIKAFFDGVEKISVTDSSISTGTRCGIAAFAAGTNKPSMDAFAAADVSAAAVESLYYYAMIRGGLNV